MATPWRSLLRAAAAILPLAVGIGAVRADPAQPANNLPDPLRQRRPADVPADEALEAAGAVIGSIEVQNLDVFDTTNPKEDNALFRLANRLHINTRERIIRQELLFREGDAYVGRILAESERRLRALRLFYDARVVPTRYADGRVDVRVVTRDVWTLVLGVRFGRSGGENAYSIGIEEDNFLGYGKSVDLERSQNVDRTTNLIRYRDPNLAATRLRLEAQYQDNSDGFLRKLALERPFFSLDTRWAAGGEIFDFDRVDPLYTLGQVRESFRHVAEFAEVGVGFSSGVVGKRVARWASGWTFDRHRFSEVPGLALITLPEDRQLIYPWIAYSRARTEFAKLTNVDAIHRSEDRTFGTEFQVRLGLSHDVFGADRNQVVLRSSANSDYGLGPGRLLLTRLQLGGRWGDGAPENVHAAGEWRYLHPTFGVHQLQVSLALDAAHNLDGERQLLLGGDSGLRGYPLRYQEGDRRVLFSLEHRFYTDWHVLQLVRVGAAVFFDAGAAWFAGSRGNETELGLLRDVGCGLRLQSSRSSGRSMLHVDVAFPLDGDDTIDRVQFLIKARDRF